VKNGQPEKKRRRLLASGWILLVLSLLLCLAGLRLSVSELPADIGNRMGDADWIGLVCIIAGVTIGALALVCFALEWLLRPRGAEGAHQPNGARSK
jgi:hypothetical protein